jgi:hypothetical protein
LTGAAYLQRRWIYDDLPVTGRFRSVDAMRVMGLMDYPELPPPFRMWTHAGDASFRRRA